MFFIIERPNEREGQISIRKNFEDPKHFPTHLKAYLDEHKIKYCMSYNDFYKETGDGAFCIKAGVNKYQVVLKTNHEPGYIMNGYSTYEDQYILQMITYKIVGDNIYQIKKELEECDTDDEKPEPPEIIVGCV